MEAVLSFVVANWGWVSSGVAGIVAIILPKKWKETAGYKLGASISAFGNKKFTKVVYEPVETLFQSIIGDFLKAFLAGLDSDDNKG